MAFSKKSYLGIDIGSSNIKLVELKREAGVLRLLSYGFAENASGAGNGNWKDDIKYSAKVIKKTMEQSNISINSAVSALPAFSVFSSIINLSNVAKKEIPSAVTWEAKKVIPLPLEDMVLDWKLIEGGENKKNENIRVLLTGAPKKLVKKYIDTFKEAKINLLSLETETFSLIRSLMGNDKSTVMIVEVGANTTDVTIVKNSIPVLNRSIDLGGLTITKSISKNLNIGLDRAEQFKFDLGIDSSKSADGVIPRTIGDTLSPAINEIKYMLNLFQDKNNEKVEKIILSGGSALLPDFDNYLSKILDMNVIIGDPWSRISYPVELEPLLRELGPKLAVAIGLAMREME